MLPMNFSITIYDSLPTIPSSRRAHGFPGQTMTLGPISQSSSQRSVNVSGWTGELLLKKKHCPISGHEHQQESCLEATTVRSDQPHLQPGTATPVEGLRLPDVDPSR